MTAVPPRGSAQAVKTPALEPTVIAESPCDTVEVSHALERTAKSILPVVVTVV